METFINKFHKNNIYIKIKNLKIISPEDFARLSKKYSKPLQVGVYSDQKELISLLEKSGFVLKRSTYELQVKKSNLTKSLKNKAISFETCKKGSYAYDQAAMILYDYYRQSHEGVNALSVSFEDFSQVLPDDVIYQKEGAKISLVAFVEANEIAYLAGFAYQKAEDFISTILGYLFDLYDEIFFEADTTDYFASLMRDFFEKDDAPRFDTYIKEAN